MLDSNHFSNKGNGDNHIHIWKKLRVHHRLNDLCIVTSNSLLSYSIDTEFIDLITNTVDSKQGPTKESIGYTTNKKIWGTSDCVRHFLILGYVKEEKGKKLYLVIFKEYITIFSIGIYNQIRNKIEFNNPNEVNFYLIFF